MSTPGSQHWGQLYHSIIICGAIINQTLNLSVVILFFGIYYCLNGIIQAMEYLVHSSRRPAYSTRQQIHV